MFILLSIPFLMNSLRFWGHGGQLLGGHPQAGFTFVPFGKWWHQERPKNWYHAKKVRKDMKWNTSQVLWKDFMWCLVFFRGLILFGPPSHKPTLWLLPIWSNMKKQSKWPLHAFLTVTTNKLPSSVGATNLWSKSQRCAETNGCPKPRDAVHSVLNF